MTITIESKFNLNDRVFCILNDKLYEGIVREILYEKRNGDPQCYFYYTIDLIFKEDDKKFVMRSVSLSEGILFSELEKMPKGDCPEDVAGYIRNYEYAKCEYID